VSDELTPHSPILVGTFVLEVNLGVWAEEVNSPLEQERQILLL
jgi:hypothetical protein